MRTRIHNTTAGATTTTSQRVLLTLALRSGRLPLAEEPLDAQDPQQLLEQHHLPREVFFFGLAVVGRTVPAPAARVVCFFVATSASLARLVQADRCYSLAARSTDPRHVLDGGSA